VTFRKSSTDGRRRSALARPSDPRPPRERRVAIEALESRCLLTITLTGVPSWVPEGPAPNANGQDENVPSEAGGGPNAVSGAIEAIAVNPGDPRNVFVGSVNGGIWRTPDITANPVAWTPLIDQYPGLEISDLRFDPTDATNQTVVAGMGNTSNIGTPLGPVIGLLRTRDGGATWSQLGNTAAMGLQGDNVSAVLPRGNTILVGVVSGTAPGLYRTINGGTTFRLISGLNGLNNGAVYDVAADPSNANRAYAVVGGATGGLFRTDDLGATWTNVTNLAAITTQLTGGLSNARLSVSAAATNPVYLAISDNSQLSGVFRSANLGVDWTPMDLPQTLDAPRTVAVASNTTPIVITTTANHGYTNGDRVRISGSADAGANGDWTISVNAATPTQFTLLKSVADGGGAGGTARDIQGIQHGRQASPNLTIATDPGNANLVYIAGDRQDFLGGDSSIGAFAFAGRIFRGDASVAAQGAGAVVTDATHQWTPLTDNGTTNTSSPHADSRAMVIDAGQLLYTGDGGVFAETGPTSTAGRWLSKNGAPNGANSGLQVTQFGAPVSYDSIANIIFGGAQDTGTPQQSAAGSKVSNDQTQGDGPSTAVDDLTSATQSARYIGLGRQFYDAANNPVGASVNLIPPGGVGGFTGFNVLTVSNVAPPAGQATRVVIANGTSTAQPGVSAIFDSTNAGNAATTGAIVYTQIPTNAGWNGVNTFFGVFAIAAGGTSGGGVNQDILYAGSGNRVFLRSTAGGTLTATTALPAGAGNIQNIALDPNDWRTAYVTDGSNVYQTTNAGTSWSNITGNLNDNLIHTIAVADNASGVSAVLVGETNGVFRMLSNAPNLWTKFGANLPNSSVWGVQYNATRDVVVAGTSGRGAWEVPSASTTLFTSGTLEIDGDMDFPNENDTIRLVLDPLNPLILDVYLNSATPVFTVPATAVNKIVVKGLGGNDNLIIDRTNGDPVPVTGGLTYDGGTHTPPGVDTLTLVGAGASLATYTRDPVTPGSGTLAVGTSTITFSNVQLTTVSNVVQLAMIGSSAAVGTYLPSATVADAGTFTLDAATIRFDTVSNATVSSVDRFALTTPNAADTVTVDTPASGQNRIRGTSGGVAFTPLTFFAVRNFTLDAASNGVDPFKNDNVTIDNSGGPALIASGLQNFTVNTGAGSNLLTVNAADFRLPVPNGKLTYNAGTGAYLKDGTPASNYRGLISLDRLVLNADVNSRIVDLPHVFKDGTPIADDTPPGEDLTISQSIPGGIGLGTLNMIGVESVVLNGGASDNVMDASAYSGAVVMNGGGGNDRLVGGSGNNTLISGPGNSTLIGGPGRSDGADGVILPNSGNNLLIAGPGTNTLIAGSGAATMIGGVGRNTFIIPNPAGSILAPVGGYEVFGAGNPGDTLILQGGGGPNFRQAVTVGKFPSPLAAPPTTVPLPNNLGLDYPLTTPRVEQFDGEITTASGFGGLLQPVTQSVRIAGLAAITDGVAVKSLSAIGAPTAGPIGVGPGNNLALGQMNLTTGGAAFTPIHFTSAATSGVYGARGVPIATFPGIAPASLMIVRAPAAPTTPAPVASGPPAVTVRPIAVRVIPPVGVVARTKAAALPTAKPAPRPIVHAAAVAKPAKALPIAASLGRATSPRRGR